VSLAQGFVCTEPACCSRGQLNKTTPRADHHDFIQLQTHCHGLGAHASVHIRAGNQSYPAAKRGGDGTFPPVISV